MSTEIQESSDENKQNGEGEGEGEGEGGEGRQDEEKSVVVADLNSLDPTTIESGIRGNEKVVEELGRSEGESRTFTMRELLNELKEEDPHTHSGDATSPHPPPPPPPPPPPYTYSEDNTQQHYIGHNKVAMELINSVTGVDEEGRSRQRILTFAAKRYANAIERNPEDYDALYNWALVLQESADNVDPDSSFPSKDSLLEEACKKYDEATCLCPTLHDATKNYEKAVQLNWNSPQKHDRQRGKLYREEDGKVAQKGSALGRITFDPKLERDTTDKEESFTARSTEKVAQKGSALGRITFDSKLPLPYLKVGYLTAPPAGNHVAPHTDWRRTQFVLNHEGLVQAGFISLLNKVEQKKLAQSPSGRLPGPTNTDKSALKIDVPDIVSVSPCADLTLPPGAGICIDTIHGPIFLVADTWESSEGWLDAIRLVYTIFARGKSDVLAGIITS
ncbi:hypothetical protein Syun_031382 [Stephania yunnanensis]|uniref:Uncharacterized protein n=1 Tax=Stephania yunnanensis TaxID=152371 RepID=A0AAP0DZZ5_9MAGN